MFLRGVKLTGPFADIRGEVADQVLVTVAKYVHLDATKSKINTIQSDQDLADDNIAIIGSFAKLGGV